MYICVYIQWSIIQAIKKNKIMFIAGKKDGTGKHCIK
jgi:hypothetical protein